MKYDKPKKKKRAVSEATFNKHFRQAGLKKNHNTCIICGKIKPDDELQIHHIIERGRCRPLKWDPMNGVCTCTEGCHGYAHTKKGFAEVAAKLGDSHMDYLYEREQLLEPTYRSALGFTKDELHIWELNRLKEIISRYTED